MRRTKERHGYFARPPMPPDGVSTVVLTLTRGARQVTFEWVGEGHGGDFDETNPYDRPLLRFTCYQRPEHGFVPDRLAPPWEEMPDASYCTLMPLDTPVEILSRAGADILVACEQEHHKRQLEKLSWMEPCHYRRGKR